MAEWTIPPTWNPGQLVSSLDLRDYGQGNHQHLYDNYQHADAPVSFSKSGRTADNTSQERKSLGTMTLESKGNDIFFVSSAEYKVGRLRTTQRGTRTTYTTGGITTTDIQLPDRVERVRTGVNVLNRSLYNEAIGSIGHLERDLSELNRLKQAGNNRVLRDPFPGAPTDADDFLADTPENRDLIREKLRSRGLDTPLDIRDTDEFISGNRELLAEERQFLNEQVEVTYEERATPGGTRQVQTVAPTTVQVTSFVRNQNTHYRVGTYHRIV